MQWINDFPVHFVLMYVDLSRGMHGFRSHIHRDHGKVSSSTRKQVDQDIILQCSPVFCKQVCSNLKELNRHLKGHIDDGSNIMCHYNGCENLFETRLLPLHTSVGSTNHVP